MKKECESDQSIDSDDLKDILESGSYKKKLEEVKDILKKKNPYQTPVPCKQDEKANSKEIEEIKEIDIDSSIGQISLSDISSFHSRKKTDPIEKPLSAEAEIIEGFAMRNETIEKVSIENELFVVTSFENVSKNKASKGLKIMEVILETKNKTFSSLNINFVVILKHSWNRTLLEVGDIVRIIGVFNHKNNFRLILDDIPIEKDEEKSVRGRFIILEPDILIPSTSISTAFPCPRVPLLRELFKNSEGDPKYALTFGNVVHLVFQRILENLPDLYVDRDQEKLDRVIRECMQEQLVSLYLIKDEHSEENVIIDIKSGISKIYDWLDSFKCQSKNQFQLKFIKQIASEQEIHSTIYGVKGKIDSTAVFEDENKKKKVTAVELKTGKRESISHIGQVRIYQMILDEVFKNSNSKHLLVYIMNDANKNKSITMIDQEAKSLIQSRNILCRYKKNIRMGRFELPPMINDDRECNKCFSKDVCCSLSISFDKYCVDNQKPEFRYFKEMSNTLNESVREYFRTWIERINNEQIESDKSIVNRAKKLKEENKVIDIEECKEPPQDEKTIKEQKELKRKIVLESNLKMTKVSPTVTGLIVSLERPIDKRLYAMIDEIEGAEHQTKELDEQAYVFLKPNVTSVVFTRGLITKKNYWVTVQNRRSRKSDLPNLTDFDSAVLEYVIEFNNQAYYNILPEALGNREWSELKWEIQKEPFSNYSFSVMRNSIFQLCVDSKLSFLRNIIINKSKPTSDALFIKENFIKDNMKTLERLNEDQQNAVIRCFNSKDYHIVEGAPQTGKKMVMLALLEILRNTKLKVLVVAKNNNILDNLLIQANEMNISFIRITNTSSQVDPLISERIKTISSFKDYEELDDMLKNENIFAATCLGCQHGILGLLNPFDICIVLDADIITEPVVLCSLILCKKFIMIGKSKDEPILVQKGSEDSNEKENLFSRLVKSHTMSDRRKNMPEDEENHKESNNYLSTGRVEDQIDIKAFK